MKHLLPLLFLALCGASFATASDFTEGNQLYADGKFAEAKQRYEAVTRGEKLSGHAFYNLGNAEFRLGEPGRAALAYERALALEPSHPEARANLAYVRGQTGARVESPRWIARAFGEISATQATVFAALAAWGVLFSIVAMIFLRRGALWMVASVLVLGFALGSLWQAGQRRTLGVVVAKESKARTAPAESAAAAVSLPAGSEVRVLQDHGAWLYCRLPDGAPGWLPAGEVERVIPANG